MGTIKKQAFFNLIFNYVGIAIGYVNVVLLFPNIFTQDQFGLTRVLISIAAIFTQIASLGGPRILVRYYPHFKNEDKSDWSKTITVSDLRAFLVSLNRHIQESSQ